MAADPAAIAAVISQLQSGKAELDKAYADSIAEIQAGNAAAVEQMQSLDAAMLDLVKGYSGQPSAAAGRA